VVLYNGRFLEHVDLFNADGAVVRFWDGAL